MVKMVCMLIESYVIYVSKYITIKFINTLCCRNEHKYIQNSLNLDETLLLKSIIELL